MSTSTSHDTNERRQAVWPWILMPVIVLIVFYTLQRFQDSAISAAQASQMHATTNTGDSVQP